MEKSLFETSRKASGGRKAPEDKKASKRPLGRALRVLRLLLNLALILIAVTLVSATALYAYVVHSYGEELDLTYPDLIQNSSVYDANGGKIGEFKAQENRRTVGSEDLGEYLPQAVVAVEDKRFYDHHGVDPNGIGRATWTDLRALDFGQGGSTITEQLVKNLYIPEERRGEVSLWRRIEQAALAFAYEQRHSKKEILTAYLNTVYFGDGAYGAEEAAKTYFGKSASDLTEDEAAALAGFLHAPSTYLSENGESNSSATARRNDVLALMGAQGMISPNELGKAQSEPLKFNPGSEPEDPAYEPFKEAVRREVEKTLGYEAMKRGGLEIHTTLNPDFQRQAIDSINGTLNLSSDPSGAVVSVEPASGAVKALAGQEGDYNLALDARRQPGSAFKPFVLAAALKEFISPSDTSYVSHKLNLNYGGITYGIQNYDGVERGKISLEKAMAESDNTVYVQLALDLGLNNVVKTARDMGITTPLEPYPATAIGGLRTGVNALDMASAYATFADGGVRREPYTIERMDKTSFGESEQAYSHKDEGRRVLSGNQAAAATQVLRGVVKSGTASFYHDLDKEIGRPSAGKTGTADEFADAWYVGYTPNLSTAVWVGYPEARTPMTNLHGEPVINGENFPLDIWSSYMAEATAGDPALNFSRPDQREFVPLRRGYAVRP